MYPTNHHLIRKRILNQTIVKIVIIRMVVNFNKTKNTKMIIIKMLVDHIKIKMI